MPFYFAAGMKMLEAKGQMTHGAFGPWVKRNFNISVQHARHYMSLADATRDIEKEAAVSDFESIKDFRRRHLGHDIPTSSGGLRQPVWRESVKENIERARAEAQRLVEENLSRQQERDAERRLALRLIDIGFKILVKELHPDKGGSRDAMLRLIRQMMREGSKAVGGPAPASVGIECGQVPEPLHDACFFVCSPAAESSAGDVPVATDHKSPGCGRLFRRRHESGGDRSHRAS
jgi:hypothetical protein